MAKGLEVVEKEIPELQCELEVTDADTDPSSNPMRGLEEKREMDQLIPADASIAAEDGLPEETTCSETEADACFVEDKEDLPGVEDSDATTETVEVIENVESAQSAEVVKNLKRSRPKPKRTAWLAGWLEESSYWEPYRGPGTVAKPIVLPDRHVFRSRNKCSKGVFLLQSFLFSALLFWLVCRLVN